MMLLFVDVAIGLALFFVAASALASTVVEALAQATGLRGKCLVDGLFRLVGDEALVRRLLHHPAIASAFADKPGLGRGPSTLSADRFVTAVLDVVPRRAAAIRGTPVAVVAGDAAVATFGQAARVLVDQGIAFGRPLANLADESEGSLDALKRALAGFYDAQGERMTHWYRVKVQKLLFACGLFLAIAFNLDLFATTNALASQPGLRAWAVGQIASVDDGARTPSPDLGAMQAAGVPIGYTCLSEDQTLRDAVTFCRDMVREMTGVERARKAIGLVLTAVGVSFGAPYWFSVAQWLLRLLGRAPTRRAAP